MTEASNWEIEPGQYSNIDCKTHVILQSNDEPPIEFAVLREAALMSKLIESVLDDDDQESEDQTIIPIPLVNGHTLKYVVQYVQHHCNNRAAPIPKPLSGSVSEVISEWDRTFLYTDLVKGGDEKQHTLLIEVIAAVHFLEINDLLQLACACVASMVRGKTPNQIRDTFNIENDFSPEEEEKIAAENRWCEEW